MLSLHFKTNFTIWNISSCQIIIPIRLVWSHKDIMHQSLVTSVSNLPLTNCTACLSMEISTSPSDKGTTMLSNIILDNEVFVVDAYSSTSSTSSKVLVSTCWHSPFYHHCLQEIPQKKKKTKCNNYADNDRVIVW